MKEDELKAKKKEFVKLYLTGKYTQREISQMLGISAQSIGRWVKGVPSSQYAKIRANLANELERLSQSPKGNEELIFKYIEHLNMLDTMIRKAKYIPNIQ